MLTYKSKNQAQTLFLMFMNESANIGIFWGKKFF